MKLKTMFGVINKAYSRRPKSCRRSVLARRKWAALKTRPKKQDDEAGSAMDQIDLITLVKDGTPEEQQHSSTSFTDTSIGDILKQASQNQTYFPSTALGSQNYHEMPEPTEPVAGRTSSFASQVSKREQKCRILTDDQITDVTTTSAIAVSTDHPTQRHIIPDSKLPRQGQKSRKKIVPEPQGQRTSVRLQEKKMKLLTAPSMTLMLLPRSRITFQSTSDKAIPLLLVNLHGLSNGTQELKNLQSQLVTIETQPHCKRMKTKSPKNNNKNVIDEGHCKLQFELPYQPEEGQNQIVTEEACCGDRNNTDVIAKNRGAVIQTNIGHPSILNQRELVEHTVPSVTSSEMNPPGDLRSAQSHIDNKISYIKQETDEGDVFNKDKEKDYSLNVDVNQEVKNELGQAEVTITDTEISIHNTNFDVKRETILCDDTSENMKRNSSEAIDPFPGVTKENVALCKINVAPSNEANVSTSNRANVAARYQANVAISNPGTSIKLPYKKFIKKPYYFMKEVTNTGVGYTCVLCKQVLEGNLRRHVMLCDKK